MFTAAQSLRHPVRLFLVGFTVYVVALATGCSGEPEVVGPPPGVKKSKALMDEKPENFGERKAR